MSLTLNMVGGAGGTPDLQTKSVSITPSESQETETVLPDAAYDGLAEVDVEVSAIPSSYVGSGITRRDSTDLTASGATVSVPSGYYENAASKAVASGTAGTPTATKGTVSSNAISVTPSVTNTAGYISGGTITGTAVSVAASELVSGTKTINANSTTLGANTDVTNYKYAKVQLSTSDAVLIVTAPKNSTVTATRSSITLTPTMWTTAADSNLACAVFIIASSQFSSSAWTVTATLNSSSRSTTVVINSAKEYEISLSFATYLIKDGALVSGVTWTRYGSTVGSMTAKTGYVEVRASSNTNNQAVLYVTSSKYGLSGLSTLHLKNYKGDGSHWGQSRYTDTVPAIGISSSVPTVVAGDAYVSGWTAYTRVTISSNYVANENYTLNISSYNTQAYISMAVSSTSSFNGLLYVRDLWMD